MKRFDEKFSENDNYSRPSSNNDNHTHSEHFQVGNLREGNAEVSFILHESKCAGIVQYTFVATGHACSYAEFEFSSVVGIC